MSYDEDMEDMTFECDSCQKDLPISEIGRSYSGDYHVNGRLTGLDLIFCKECMGEASEEDSA